MKSDFKYTLIKDTASKTVDTAEQYFFTQENQNSDDKGADNTPSNYLYSKNKKSDNGNEI